MKEILVNPNRWLTTLASLEPWRELLEPAPEQREAAGYGHTLAEICQQPETWTATARQVIEARAGLVEPLKDSQWLVITGSGSSQYAGECIHPALQVDLGIPALTLGGGWLLVEGTRAVPPARPGLLVSLARSGDSPESGGVAELFLGAEPRVKHLIVTCNARGRLASCFSGDPRVMVLLLDDRTNDRSLVMTSSFTNMVIAARALGFLGDPGAFEKLVDGLASAAKLLLLNQAGVLAGVARGSFKKAVYLASGCRFGAARECALKMLEMNSGRIPTMPETYLGVRHGPMCVIDRETLVVCFLDSNPLARRYEEDLVTEINRKGLGARKLIVGANIPSALLTGDDVALEIPGAAALGDANVPVLDVMVGQLLAFFRCLAGGLRPDKPVTGIINRVVDSFTVYPHEQ